MELALNLSGEFKQGFNVAGPIFDKGSMTASFKTGDLALLRAGCCLFPNFRRNNAVLRADDGEHRNLEACEKVALIHIC